MAPGLTYIYRVAVLEAGEQLASFEMLISIPDVNLELFQNFPNPFNPSTTIGFTLPVADRVRIVVYDARGGVVKKLLDGVRGPGYVEVNWDGTNHVGARVSSGVYMYRLRVGTDVLSKKMMVLK